MIPNVARLRERCEADGLEVVKMKLRKGAYLRDKVPAIQAWVEEKEAEKKKKAEAPPPSDIKPKTEKAPPKETKAASKKKAPAKKKPAAKAKK